MEIGDGDGGGVGGDDTLYAGPDQDENKRPSQPNQAFQNQV